MGLKEDKVTAFVSAVQAAQTQVLVDQGGSLYDAAFQDGLASAPPSTGGDPTKIFSQADLDQAVATAVAGQQGADAQGLSDAIATAKADHDALQAQIDSVSNGKQAAESVVKDLQDKLTAAKASFDAVFAFFAGTSAPPPADGGSGQPVPVSVQSLAKPKLDLKHD